MSGIKEAIANRDIEELRKEKHKLIQVHKRLTQEGGHVSKKTAQELANTLLLLFTIGYSTVAHKGKTASACLSTKREGNVWVWRCTEWVIPMTEDDFERK